MAKTLKWKAGGLIFGNSFFALREDDASRTTALMRRFFLMVFTNPISPRDSHLEERIMKELPYIMLKMARSYTLLLKYMNENNIVDIEELWPSYFTDTLKIMRLAEDSLEHFLQQPMFEFLDVNTPRTTKLKYVISFKQFKSLYVNFCADNKEKKFGIHDLPDCMIQRGLIAAKITDLHKFPEGRTKAQIEMDNYTHKEVRERDESYDEVIGGIIFHEDKVRCDPINVHRASVSAMFQPTTAAAPRGGSSSSSSSSSTATTKLSPGESFSRLRDLRHRVDGAWGAEKVHGVSLTVDDEVRDTLYRDMKELSIHGAFVPGGEESLWIEQELSYLGQFVTSPSSFI
jgi:hypothetical protein